MLCARAALSSSDQPLNKNAHVVMPFAPLEGVRRGCRA
jgi:hypothetical protein